MNTRQRQIAEWMDGQGRKIKGSRPRDVYNACVLEAAACAGSPGWRFLTAEQIDICEQRAVSQKRKRMFGTLPAENAHWDEQIAKVREEWNTIEGDVT